MGKKESFKEIRKLADSMEGNSDKHYKNMKKIYYSRGTEGILEYRQMYEIYMLTGQKEKTQQ